MLGPPIEEFVAEAVLTWFDSPAVYQAIRQTTRRAASDNWQMRTDQLSGKLDELAETYAANAISMREWLAAREPIQRQLDDAQKQLMRLSGVTVLAQYADGKIRERWEGLSIDQQRAVITAALHHVVVMPGRRGLNKFQPERFQLVWRH